MKSEVFNLLAFYLFYLTANYSGTIQTVQEMVLSLFEDSWSLGLEAVRFD